MKRVTKFSSIIIAALLPFCSLHAFSGPSATSGGPAESACDLDIQEQATLSFQAKQVSPSASKVDVALLARDAIQTCYNAYAPNVSQLIRQDIERLSGMGSGGRNSSGARLIPIQYAKVFAEAIINQLGTITGTLSHSDRQLFWNTSAYEIKQVLASFCQAHGAKSTGDLNPHIDNLIQMKKTFG